jgi:peptidoglycan glycosyltransferase
MRARSRTVLFAGAFALLGALPVPFQGRAQATPSDVRRRSPTAGQGTARESLLRGFDPRHRTLVDGRFVTPLASGASATLTVSPDLEDHIARLLKASRVQAAGVVALEPATGRVLAYVSHSADASEGVDRARDASAPAASVFKVITSAALLSQGVRPDASTCYHGGSSALTIRELTDHKKLDTACASLTGALGSSLNAVFGKLALRHLSRSKLKDHAAAFGFGEALPFDAKVPVSAIDVPVDKLEFARTAAGFFHSRMSPLHAAMIASAVADHGRMMRPFIVDEVRDKQGRLAMRAAPALHRAAISRGHADTLARMMKATVTQGTGRKSFYDERGRPYLPGIEVAGKTGTLSEENPYRGYTWWVGFAPADAPKIAVGVLVVNSPEWRIKAPVVGREAMRHFLVEMPRKAGAVADARSKGGRELSPQK